MNSPQDKQLPLAAEQSALQPVGGSDASAPASTVMPAAGGMAPSTRYCRPTLLVYGRLQAVTANGGRKGRKDMGGARKTGF